MSGRENRQHSIIEDRLSVKSGLVTFCWKIRWLEPRGHQLYKANEAHQTKATLHSLLPSRRGEKANRLAGVLTDPECRNSSKGPAGNWENKSKMTEQVWGWPDQQSWILPKDGKEISQRANKFISFFIHLTFIKNWCIMVWSSAGDRIFDQHSQRVWRSGC